MTNIILTVFRLNGALASWGDAFGSTEGLTSARWQMLGALALAGQPQTAPQVATRMGLTRQGAQKQLNLLAADGLVESHPNPRHQRSPLFVLTRQGQQAYASVDERWRAHAQRVAVAFSPADLDAVGEVLTALVQTYTSEEPDHEA
ncbi:MarR family winged helix-turn-helix transcriptional regulator [Xylophilus sp. ASV27]|uniref:MarR family winged helix-turn-helix transcriptional regulator n=1 Tax=Xylophilus sp. ASV27 TaxID=2795129 RepID=UPI001E551DC8|nr:helix-turn-helix domain-containing protein [Xylophilus sp. ASV27]